MGGLFQILKNTVTGWLALGVRAGIALIMVPFLLAQLGKEGYGLIGLLGVLVSMVSVVDLGLRSALGRELAEQLARNDKRAFNELLSTAFILYAIIGVVVASVNYLIAPWLVSVFNISENLRGDAILLVRLYGTCSIVLSFITPVFSAALTSHHRFDLVNLINTVGGLISSLLLFLVLSGLGNSLFGWVAVMLMMQVIALLFNYILFCRYCIDGAIGVRYLNFKRLNPLFRLGGYMYIIQLARLISESADPLIISRFFGPSGVALYQPGGKLSQNIRPVVSILAGQMYPLTTKYHIDGEVEKMKEVLVLTTKYTLLAGVLFSAGIFVFADSFCRLWLENSLGEDYIIAAVIMKGWAILDLLVYASGAEWPVLLGMNRLKVLVWALLPSAILNILVSVYLVGYTDVGIPGVLFATIVIGLIRRPFLLSYTAKVCGISPVIYFYRAYFTPFICLIITYTGAHILNIALFPESWGELALCGLMTVFFWAISCLCIGLNSLERTKILNLAQKGLKYLRETVRR